MTYAVVWAPRSPSHYEELVEFVTGPDANDDSDEAETARSEFVAVLEGDPLCDVFGVSGDDLRSREFVDERTGVSFRTTCLRGVAESDARSGDPVTFRLQYADDTSDANETTWRPATGIECHYSVVGTLAAAVGQADAVPNSETDDGPPESTALRDFFKHVARTEWEVLGRQLDAGEIPLGVTTVEIAEYEQSAVFPAVCHEFLSACVRKTREFSPKTDQTKISNLLQRVEQAETCYDYATRKWNLEDHELRQLVDYAKQIVGMLFKKVEIKSEVRLQMIAIVGTLSILWSGIFTFLVNRGVVPPNGPLELLVTLFVAGLAVYIVAFAVRNDLLRVGNPL